MAALSAAFGAGLVQATAYLSALFGTGAGAVSAAMTALALVFVGISIYVGAVVISNTFATIVTARTRSLALQRLLGSDAARLRRGVSREGLLVGVIGAALGSLIGVGLATTLLAIGRATDVMPAGDYPLLTPTLLLPIVAVIVTTWAASRVGSRQVLRVSPAQAIDTAGVDIAEPHRSRVARAVIAALLAAIGVSLLALGVVVGFVTPFGMVIAMFGGFISFAGVLVGAHHIMPAQLNLVGKTLGRSVPARMAAANALRYPGRSTRTTIGLVIGVTLITTFTVAGSTYRDMARGAASTVQQRQTIDQVLAITIGVMAALIGFSAVIAAVGMVNNLSLSVLQRTKEIGLLRALGLTGGQVRTMILAESVQMSVTATGLGLALGILYGWAGAQSMLSSVVKSSLVLPSVPWQLLAAVILGAVALAAVSSLAPSRRATRIPPVTALAVQ
ncbi:MAG: transporter integral rane protein [Microbacteriaceae bacterium]|nr:transporter integral rane protein [Microbacteriaceae bacterium]